MYKTLINKLLRLLLCYKGPVSQKNLKSSSDLKHGKDNGINLIRELKSVSRLKILLETGP